MSAFLCSDYHIATMAHYINTMHSNIDAQSVANKIKAINIDSINYRYNDKARKTKCNIKAYREINKNDFAALFACWDYQSCEGDLLDYLILRAFLLDYAEKGNSLFSDIQWSI